MGNPRERSSLFNVVGLSAYGIEPKSQASWDCAVYSVYASMNVCVVVRDAPIPGVKNYAGSAAQALQGSGNGVSPGANDDRRGVTLQADPLLRYTRFDKPSSLI